MPIVMILLTALGYVSWQWYDHCGKYSIRAASYMRRKYDVFGNDLKSCTAQQDGLFYQMKPASFLIYDGFFSVSTAESVINNSEELNITLYFWPQADAEIEKGVMFYRDSDGLMLQCYVDDELNWLNREAFDGRIQQTGDVLFEKYHEQICEMMVHASAFYHLK